MTGLGADYDGPSMRALVHVLLVAASLTLLTACGVRFGAAERGTEFFKAIEITGEMRAGSTLTVLVDYDQYYPVEVEFVCELRKNKQLIKFIGRDTVAALPGGNPEATPFPGSIAFDFVVDEPGRYRVECLTPKDDDNFIAEFITVKAPDAQAGN